MKTTTALIVAAGIATAASAGISPLINEVQPNQPGSDPSTQSLELRGAAGASFSGVFYSLDTDFSPGQTIDRLEVISGTFDSNGLLVVNIADLENPSATYILASGGTAQIGDAFSGDIAGQFGTVYDAVNSPDRVDDEANSLAGNFLGAATDFDPNFDVNVGSFGAANLTVVPAPAALAVLGLGGIAAGRRRR